MQQDQRIILRMLEEGKITAAEAEALLNALGDSASQTEGGQQEEPWVRLEKMGEDFASKVEAATERFTRSLEQKTEGLGERLSKMLAKVPFIGDDTYEFTQVYRGQIGETEEAISIALDNFNGPVQVEGWLEDTYQLTIVQRAKGRDREQIRGDLFTPNWVDGALKTDFELQVPDQDGVIISLHLRVPEKLLYDVRLASRNGSLTIGNLRVSAINLDTVNGSTNLYRLDGGLIKGRSQNGSCRMDNVTAEKVYYRLNNGSYRLNLAAQEVDCVTINGSLEFRPGKLVGKNICKLRSTNGSLRIFLPADPKLGVALRLSTSVGRIANEFGALETIQEERTGGGTSLVGRSVGYGDQSDLLELEAHTTAGSITVAPGPSID